MQQQPRTAVASGMLLLGLTVLSMAVAAASEVEPPLPPLPPFASAPPVGVILEEPSVDESDAAVDIQLVAAELLLVQSTGDGKSASETPSQTQAAGQEQREQQEKKDQESSAKSCGEQSKDCQQALKALRDDGLETIALDIRVSGRPGSDYPCECRLEGESYQPRRFATTMTRGRGKGSRCWWTLSNWSVSSIEGTRASSARTGLGRRENVARRITAPLETSDGSVTCMPTFTSGGLDRTAEAVRALCWICERNWNEDAAPAVPSPPVRCDP